jgi:pyrroline-5-carboxylate reductase
MNSQPDLTRYQLGFIGAGKLAGSVIRGLVRAEVCPANEIIASEPDEKTRLSLKQDVNVNLTADNAEAAEKAALVVIGVKPAVVLPVLRELSAYLENKLVISLAAGVRLKRMEATANARFLRALTNTPSAIGRAATAFARGRRVTPEDIDVTKKIFSAIGVLVEVEEEQIDAVTALAGSGPAFVYAVIDALAQGGKKMGLTHDIALKLATQTVLGAAQLALETKKTPQELIQMVVTPGGTTAAGLDIMQKFRTSEGLIAAVEAATKRGREMAQENL